LNVVTFTVIAVLYLHVRCGIWGFSKSKPLAPGGRSACISFEPPPGLVTRSC
jgi:hypothetical protein